MLFAYAAFLNHKTVAAAADDRVTRSLDVLHEHALKVFQSVELAINHTAALTDGLSDDEIKAAQNGLHGKLEQIVGLAPEIASIWIFDRHGYPLVSSALFPAPVYDASDRDFFRAQAERERGLYVGEVLQSRVIGPPFFGISKEIDMSFCLGYDPMEFAGSLRSIAEGEIDVRPMITSEVNLDGVAGAFQSLGDPEQDCKILVVPNAQ